MFNLVELRHLRYFLAAADQGSFRKAGVFLGVRESAISRGIRDLEAQVGVPLFRRQLGGASLNPAGLRFYQQVQAAMMHLRDGARDAGAIGRIEKGHIKIGISSSLASGFLSDLFHAYGTLHPGVRIDFMEGRRDEHITAVRHHQLDAAFIAGIDQHSGCDMAYLWSEQIIAALPTSHHLARQTALAWSDLEHEILILSDHASGWEIEDRLSKRLSGLRSRPDFLWQNVCRDNLLSLVAIGRGLALTTQMLTTDSFPNVIYCPIAGEMLPFSALWSSRNDNPALRRLLSIARARHKIAKPIGLPIVLPTDTSNVELS